MVADNVLNAMLDGNTFVNPFAPPSTNGDMCMYALTVSTMEPRNVKEAMIDHAWIGSMQEELLQFKRLDVWVLVPATDNIKPLTLKWLLKNKHDEENTVIRNMTRLVPTGKISTSSTTKVDSETLNGSNEDITNPHECEQTLGVSAGFAVVLSPFSRYPEGDGECLKADNMVRVNQIVTIFLIKSSIHTLDQIDIQLSQA
ncbi:hypothetical protein Tco_0902663 [Tanacetum coccineum]